MGIERGLNKGKKQDVLIVVEQSFFGDVVSI